MRRRTEREELFRTGMRCRIPDCPVQTTVLPKVSSSLETEALAYTLVVPRSVCRTAVGRNRVRRLLRESLRAILSSQPALVAPYRALALRWSGPSTTDCKRLRLRDVLPHVVAVLTAASTRLVPHGC
ncbi:MAG: ribonuclease P protein component [Bacteroidota bacterium]|nr:ribonuclease P protein component [Candidatus Kapabacteria bacterium]MCS7302854.1 ribonuclease P protein component [Candidatus Kapabacteria bacterium]MCX7937169.1 ribonuclease P protein component [Chlorobiota bacterium]MDW8075246.1 ribonuclease P protein component [Bacteroidota bacterium]MDW8271859.1 ribonuclease P protein component [Bacteroidota bacterium]